MAWCYWLYPMCVWILPVTFFYNSYRIGWSLLFQQQCVETHTQEIREYITRCSVPYYGLVYEAATRQFKRVRASKVNWNGGNTTRRCPPKDLHSARCCSAGDDGEVSHGKRAQVGEGRRGRGGKERWGRDDPPPAERERGRERDMKQKKKT